MSRFSGKSTDRTAEDPGHAFEKTCGFTAAYTNYILYRI